MARSASCADADETNNSKSHTPGSRLQRLLASLSGRQRDVVALRYLADLSELEVADELGISVGTVKTHAYRGIATLRQHLDSSSDRASFDSEVTPRKEPTDV
jgi:RNA polymerase sigma factor (sigma-70 family)